LEFPGGGGTGDGHKKAAAGGDGAAYRARANSASRFQTRRTIVRFNAEAISDREDAFREISGIDLSKDVRDSITRSSLAPNSRLDINGRSNVVGCKKENGRNLGEYEEQSSAGRCGGGNWTVRDRIDSSMDLLVPSDRGGSVCTFVT
jgi:hypothetical protein